MRAVVQRVIKAGVDIIDKNKTYTKGEIETGLVVLLGVEKGDTEKDARYMADKICGLRIFEDEDGKMNLSVGDVGGKILAISQFTLLGDVKKGKRPGFSDAEEPKRANELYEKFMEFSRENDITVKNGIFQAEMLVRIYNDGPVTILIDSNKKF